MKEIIYRTRHESAVVRSAIEPDDNRETINGHTPIRSAETCNVSEHIARGLPHTIIGTNNHSQCRRGEICSHANVRVPEIDRDRFMVMHREFVLDYTSEMVNTIMEFERGVNGLTYRYVYGALNVFGLQARESVTITGEQTVRTWLGSSTRQIDEMFFYHSDRLGSSVMLTSGNGRIVSSVEYDSWGRPVGGDGLTVGNREIDLVTRYTGHRYDSVMGMYYARFRMYDPMIRRFTAVDPVVGTIMNARTMVQYTYVLNNPLRFIDPWGLFAGHTFIGAESAERLGVEPGFHERNSDAAQAWRDSLSITQPPSLSFSAILDSVMEYFDGLTNNEIFRLVESGFLESLGFSMPSDWIESMGSIRHVEANEWRQVLAHSMAYAIYQAYQSNANDTVFYQNSRFIAATVTQHFGFGTYGHSSANRQHETMRFINEQVRIEQHMIERYGIKYWQTTGQCTMSRTPMAERSFLSDPHLARYMSLQERKSTHDFLLKDSILANLSDHLVNEFGRTPGTTTTFWGSVGDVVRATGNSLGSFFDNVRNVDNDRGQTLWDMIVGNPNSEGLTAHDLAWMAGMSFTASGMYMTSGQWIGTSYAGAVFFHANSGLTGSAGQNQVRQEVRKNAVSPEPMPPRLTQESAVVRKYTPPPGGGGVSTSIKVGDKTINFGHGGRHAQAAGLDLARVQQALANEVVRVHPGKGQHSGTILFDGITIEYSSFGFGDGVFNIGTFFVPPTTSF